MTQTESETQTEQVDISKLEFADYERVRRGEKIESAPEATSEQKESTKSGTEETEAKEESTEESEEELKDSMDDESEEEAKDEKPKKKGGFQRRIDKLNAAKAEAQKEAEYWKRMALEKGAGEKKEAPKVEKKADGKPSPDDFETHAEYVEALTDWKVEQKERERDEKQRKTALEKEHQSVVSAHQERVKSFAKSTPDYHEVVAEAGDIEFSPAATEAILKSELGPQIIYELAKNLEEAERIAKLPPIAAAQAIGKLEAKIEIRASEEKKPEPKKLTKAPPPPKPVGGSKATTAKSIYDPDISFEEYEQRRREAMRRRA